MIDSMEFREHNEIRFSHVLKSSELSALYYQLCDNSANTVLCHTI
jgi:hypothetical protein